MREIVKVANMQRRLQEQGRIRFGEKGPKGEPRKLEVFRFTSRDRQAIEELAALYGGDPRPWPERAEEWQLTSTAKSISVVLPPDPLGGTPLYELWSGGGLLRRCDGDVCVVPRSTPSGADMVEQPCVCDRNGVLECKPITRLTVLLPDIRFAGGWRIESHGWNAWHELPGMVEVVQSLQQRGLTRATLSLDPRKDKSGGKTRHYVVPVLSPDVTVNAILSGDGQVQALGRASDPEPDEAAEDRRELVTPGDGVCDADPTASSAAADIVDAEIVTDVSPEVTRLRRNMHAKLRELGMGNTERHALTKKLTKGRTETSNDLTAAELTRMIQGLTAIKKAEFIYEGEDDQGMAIVSKVVSS